MALELLRLDEFAGRPGWRTRLREFDCGTARWELELNNYLGHGLAVRDQRQHLAGTHLAFGVNEEVVGYVTVAWTCVQRTDEDRTVYPYKSILGLLLARLAVSLRHRGQDLGDELMKWVHAFAFAAAAPCRLIALHVDRENPAVTFYERYGFRVFEDPSDSPLLLMAKDIYRS